MALKGFAIACVVGIGAYAVYLDKDKTQSATPAPTATVAAAPSKPPKPMLTDEMLHPTERAFLRAVEAAQRQYATGGNDMQKGAARAQRADAICNLLRSMTMTNWAGKITRLTTNGDGNGVIAIEIGKGIAVKTWNNSLSDIGDRTLIDPRSPLFATLSMLQVGQLVQFSGSFFPNSTDCVRESSMTLQGSLEEPEYIFRFGSVTPIGQ